MAKVRRKLLVTGCGRSGTKHIANLLRRVGLKVGHEQVLADGVSSAFFVTYGGKKGHVSPNEYQPYAHKPEERPADFKFDLIWHQVRDPLKTIGSVRDVHKASIVRWSKEVLGQTHVHPKLKHDLEYAARHWLLVNQMSEEIADFRYRIEDIGTVWPKMVTLLGLPKGTPLPDVSKTMGRSYRTIKQFRPTKEIYDSISYPTWADIAAIDPKLCKDIQRLAKRYGYGTAD